MVNVNSGAPLKCEVAGPADASGNFNTNCIITQVWERPRRSNINFVQVNASAFTFKIQNKLLRVMVDATALDASFTKLQRRRRQLSDLQGEEEDEEETFFSRHLQSSNPLDSTLGIYFDPMPTDGVSPFWPGTTLAQVPVEMQQSDKNEQQAAAEEDALEAAFDCFQAWIIKHKVRLNSKRNGGVWTAHLYDIYQYYMYYGTMPKKCVRLLTQSQQQDLQKKKKSNKKKTKKPKTTAFKKVKSSASVASVGSSSSSSGSGNGLTNDIAVVENFPAHSFIKDYAIIVSTPYDGVIRLDVTLVPRLFRTDADGQDAFLCPPNNKTAKYMPTVESCKAIVDTVRRPNAPYAINDPDAATLHPEENAWLQQRLSQKTNPGITKFVSANFPIASTFPSASNLKIAVAASGGGKRAAINSFGKK